MSGVLQSLDGEPGEFMTLVRSEGSPEECIIVATPGGSSGPEGNIFWLDPLFAGTSDGSIAAPFTTFAEFWAAVVAGGPSAYKLMLPAPGVAIDSPLPALGAGSWTITLAGSSKEATQLGDLVVAAQTGSLLLQFYDCHFDSWTFASGSVDMFCQSVSCNGCTMTAVVTGTLTAYNCDFVQLKLRQQSYVLVMFGGTIAGIAPLDTEWKDGRLNAVTFAPGTLPTPSGTTHFVNCDLSGVSAFGNDHNPTLDFDPYSLQTYDNGGGGNLNFLALTYTPNPPRINQASESSGTTIAAGDSAVIDFGNMPGSYRWNHAEPGSNCVAQWAVNPGVGLVIQSSTVDGASGHILVRVGNVTALPLTMPAPSRVNVTYTPRFTP